MKKILSLFAILTISSTTSSYAISCANQLVVETFYKNNEEGLDAFKKDVENVLSNPDIRHTYTYLFDIGIAYLYFVAKAHQNNNLTQRNILEDKKITIKVVDARNNAQWISNDVIKESIPINEDDTFKITITIAKNDPYFYEFNPEEKYQNIEVKIKKE